MTTLTIEEYVNTATTVEVLTTILEISDLPMEKSTGAEVTTGTDDEKFVTPKAIKDAGVVAPPTTAAENDFQVGGVGGTAGSWVKKTLAQTLTILGKAAASGLASLDGSSKVVQDPANATATATAGKMPIADGSGKLDTWLSDASTTTKGKVELTEASEVNTGTSETLAITPDSFAGSNFGRRPVQIKIVDDATALTTGDGKLIFVITPELNGMNLVDADAMVSTVSSSGTPTYQIRNVTDSVDMLSTRITIDANEETSYTAATPPVIDTTKDDVVTGDILAIDKDVAGTGEKGDTIMLAFQLP